MTCTAKLAPRPSAVLACTISRGLAGFDRLVDEMEAELAEEWADIALEDAARFLRGRSLKFALIALDAADEGNPAIAEAVGAARQTGCRVILVTDGIGPAALQSLLRLRPDEVLPYPLAPGALQSIARPLREVAPLGPSDDLAPASVRPGWTPRGRVLGVMGMAGGVGCTTIATNLAWELSANGRVCLVDMTLHAGSEEAVLTSHLGRVQRVAPVPRAAARMVDFARAEYDFVVIDLPWTPTPALLDHTDLCLAVMRPDIRSARNARHLAQTLSPEGAAKLRPVLNHAPGRADVMGRRRWALLARTLGLEPGLHLPAGGAAVTRANDLGLPLARSAARIPLRRAVARLAGDLRT